MFNVFPSNLELNSKLDGNTRPREYCYICFCKLNLNLHLYLILIASDPRLGPMKPNRLKAVTIFLFASSFYLYEFILQVSPSVMANGLMGSFNVGAAGLGLISSCYFYSYALTQFPAGLLYDCYGPRRVMTVAILLCVIGTVFFALTDSISMACLGRILIGFGSSFSFVGILVLVAKWFKPHQFALLVGIAQSCSSFGAIFGEYPLAKLTEFVGWRHSLLLLAGIGLLLALLIWLIVRDSPREEQKKPHPLRFIHDWYKLVVVMKKPQTWWVGLFAGCSWTPVAVFAVLWGVPYLSELRGLSVGMAATYCSIVWIAIALFCPLIGWFSDKIKSRRIPLILTSLVGLFGSLLLYNADKLPVSLIIVGLCAIGFAGTGQTITFAIARENNAASLIGSASGFNNMAVLIGAAFLQPAFGLILKFSGSLVMQNNIPVYSISAYKEAFLMIPLLYVVGLLTVLIFIKEPKHKSI